MTKYLLPLLTALLFSGCGYSPDKPVYDTAGNPDDFPKLALQLLDRIEDDQLASFESISEAFGQLYTEHSDLLDNDAWKSVIDRLGARFACKGDQTLEGGLDSYTQTAGYYVLAAFARPKDQEIGKRGRLFSTWLEMAADSGAAALIDSLSSDAPVSRRLRLIKRFALADSLHMEFARQYLSNELFGAGFGGITPSQRDELTKQEKALAAHLGLVEITHDSKLVSFDNGTIDLVCTDISPVDPNVYLAVFYFYPHTNPGRDYTVLFRINTVDSSLRTSADPLRFVPFDFEPETPTSQWEKGQLAVAYRTIQFLGPIREISIGLMDKSVNPPQFLAPAGTNDKTYHLVLSDVEVQ